MKILFAIQGTGNGHISRARDIIPHLQKYGDLDILVSGTQAEVTVGHPVKYQLHGFSFVFGKNGGVNHWETFRIMKLGTLRKDIKKLPLEEYDLIINDFEPVTAWACKLRNIPCVALSHQSAFLSKKTPRPKRIIPHWAELVLKHYAPVKNAIGIHFKEYDDFIYTPVIRKEIRELTPTNLGHYTVYLPAYHDKLLAEKLIQVNKVNWHIFSKHTKIAYEFGNVKVEPISNDAFNKSLASCEGLLTGGGFEGPAEAMFLGKKVMSIPMFDQWEQLCNAEAMRLMGVPIVYKIDDFFVKNVLDWVKNGKVIPVNFADRTAEMVAELVNKYSRKN